MSTRIAIPKFAIPLIWLCLATFAAFAPKAGAAAEAATKAGSKTTESRKSGYDFMSASTQALQNDDSQNPAMLWVKDGEALWNREAGDNKKSCASCHGLAPKSMLGVAARYPAIEKETRRPINLQQRINLCQKDHQHAALFAPETQEMLGIESYVGLQSRGLPITPPRDARLAAYTQKGKVRFEQRIGQLDLSCADCHDNNAGKKLGGATIPEAHPTAYPLYRLEWQSLGGVERRLRNCMSGVRAEPYAYGAPEFIELELYLAARAAGMKMETPGVRP
jgi:sulfur-oxidizing protein SoxA